MDNIPSASELNLKQMMKCPECQELTIVYYPPFVSGDAPYMDCECGYHNYAPRTYCTHVEFPAEFPISGGGHSLLGNGCPQCDQRVQHYFPPGTGTAYAECSYCGYYGCLYGYNRYMDDRQADFSSVAYKEGIIAASIVRKTDDWVNNECPYSRDDKDNMNLYKNWNNWECGFVSGLGIPI